MAPVKDVELLGQVVRRAAAERTAARFVIVGDGEQRAALETAIQGCGNVVLLGWRRDMENVWSAADAAILTSRNEGTPTALIEAMAVGLPFVATNVGAVADLAVGPLQDLPGGMGYRAGNGYLTARTSNALGYSIGELIAQPELARQMGAVGYAFVNARFGSDRLVRELESLYLNLLDKKGCRTASTGNGLPEQDHKGFAVAAGSENNRNHE
jgi:glycosyltransferase involved in cell wall biosynthesis